MHGEPYKSLGKCFILAILVCSCSCCWIHTMHLEFCHFIRVTCSIPNNVAYCIIDASFMHLSLYCLARSFALLGSLQCRAVMSNSSVTVSFSR